MSWTAWHVGQEFSANQCLERLASEDESCPAARGRGHRARRMAQAAAALRTTEVGMGW